MKSLRILTTIKAALNFIALMAIIVACDSEQGMVHGGSGSMNTGNWNWVLILLGLIILFLLGYLIAKRRK